MKRVSSCQRADHNSQLEPLHTLKDGPAQKSGVESTASSPEQRGATLRDAEERMRAILETAVEGIITVDERGIIESVNRAAERIFGYQAQELQGKNISLLMPRPYREDHDLYIANYLQTGQAKVIGIGREVEGERKDGTIFPMDLAVSEVHLAERRLFTGFVRDISERKRAELCQQVQYATVAALAESSSLSEGAPKVMKGICEVTGWTFGEFWGVDRDAQVVHLVQTWAGGVGESMEFAENTKGTICQRGVGIAGRIWESGKAEWIPQAARDSAFMLLPKRPPENLGAAVGFPISLGSEVLGVMLFFSHSSQRIDQEVLNCFTAIGNQLGQFIERNRAESKLAQLARPLVEKNKELEAIVYVASHDLRSPLVNIQGFSQELSRACESMRSLLLREDSRLMNPEVRALLTQDIPEALDFILAGVKKIDSLLSGFLRYSRLGRAMVRPERIQMNDMLKGIAQVMDFQLKSAGAELKIMALPDCVADPTQLNQVFTNLLDNAVKYRDKGRPGVIVVSGVKENGRVTYQVSDNGVGIAQEHQGRVFEIFHRLDPDASDGDGLGLTIAQRILERHGGRIWLESKPGQGSRFFVSLPDKALA